MKKTRKSVWLPILLLVYFAAMAVIFGKDMIMRGEWINFTLISVAEIAAIFILHLFLKKQERLRGKR